MPDLLPRSGLATRVPVLAAVAVLVLALSGGAPAGAQTDEALRRELEQLEQQRAALSAHLARATERLEAARAELARVEREAASLTSEVARLDAAAETHAAALAQRVRALYQGASSGDLLDVLAGAPASQVAERSHYLVALGRAEQAGLETSVAARRAAAARRAELDAVLTDVQRLKEEAAAATADLDRQLAAASEREGQIRGEIERREERARQLAAAARRRATAARTKQSTGDSLAATSARPMAASSGSSAGKACPQDHPRSFSDTWGAPRSGGRRHEGTDIFGARGGDVFAITSGVVEWTKTGRRSGLFLSLRGDDGHQYWYIHLQDFVARAGQRVVAGDLIAHNGDTGNARGTSPHIHFEYHPGGGGPVNPYPMLKQICG